MNLLLVFLENAHRVEALVFLMMMSLTLYFVPQRTYRATAEEDATTKERRTTRPRYRCNQTQVAEYQVKRPTPQAGQRTDAVVSGRFADQGFSSTITP